jgi:hypothetical protein
MNIIAKVFKRKRTPKPVTVQLILDGKVLHASLLKLKGDG